MRGDVNNKMLLIANPIDAPVASRYQDGPRVLPPVLMRSIRTLSALVVSAAVLAAACDQKAKNAEIQADAHADLAREAFQRGDARLALDEAQQAVSFDDSNARAHQLATAALLALCAGDEGIASTDCRLDLAERHARRATLLDPTDRNARNTLGSVLLLDGSRGADAREVLRPLTEDPAYASAHLAWANYGWAQLQVGDVDGAVTSLRRATREPRFCVGWYRLAVAYDRSGNASDAEASASRALAERSPECQSLQDAWKLRGELRARLGKPEEARADLEACARLAPHTASGRACTKAKDLVPAVSGRPS